MQVGHVSSYLCAGGLTSAVVAGVVTAAAQGAGMAAAPAVKMAAAGLGADGAVAAEVASAWEAVGMVRLQSTPHEHVMSSLPARAQAKDDSEQASHTHEQACGNTKNDCYSCHIQAVRAWPCLASYHPGACQLLDACPVSQELGAGAKQAKRTAGGTGTIDSAAGRAQAAGRRAGLAAVPQAAVR